jgi:dihydrodipicolinate synthase/N-acetylneuraminate lyase
MTSPKRYRSGILGTCCLPWNENFELDEPLFRRGIRRQIAAGIRDLYVFGTAGEGYAVTEAQFDAITRIFLEETRIDGVQSMVGLISQSLPAVIERIERALDLGARRFQISFPGWGALNDAEVRTFFRETCGRFPDCEFLHYNLARAGRLLTGAEYGALAAAHQNLVATKNSTADEASLSSLMHEAPQLQHFITEGGYPIAAMIGECGFLISYTSTNFDRAREFFEAGRSRNGTRLAEITRDFPGLIAAFKEAVGGTAHMDGAFDKLFCRIHDPDFPLRLLPPYAGVSDDRFDQYLRVLRRDFPRWLP